MRMGCAARSVKCVLVDLAGSRELERIGEDLAGSSRIYPLSYTLHTSFATPTYARERESPYSQLLRKKCVLCRSSSLAKRRQHGLGWWQDLEQDGSRIVQTAGSRRWQGAPHPAADNRRTEDGNSSRPSHLWWMAGRDRPRVPHRRLRPRGHWLGKRPGQRPPQDPRAALGQQVAERAPAARRGQPRAHAAPA